MTIRLVLILLCICGSAYGQSKQPDSLAHRSMAQTIRGIWWSTEPEPSAAFVINDSIIYYPDMLREYKFSIIQNTLFVHGDDGISVHTILKATADTLILQTFDIKQIYTRGEPPPH